MTESARVLMMMNENDLRVPTVPLPATIRYFDEREIRGEIFLPAAAQHHGGALRPDEWMNQSALFFPFRHEDGRRVILNKRYVVVLNVSLSGEQFERDTDTGTVRKVEVECGTIKLTGTVYIDMPDNQRRLTDFLNRSEQFLSLHDGDNRQIIQKNRITAITEIVEESS